MSVEPFSRLRRAVTSGEADSLRSYFACAQSATLCRRVGVVDRPRVVLVWSRDGECAGYVSPRGVSDLGSGCETVADGGAGVDEAFLMPAGPVNELRSAWCGSPRYIACGDRGGR